MAIDFARLLAHLNDTQLVKKDISLFSLLKELIGKTDQLQSATSVSLSSVTNPLTVADFITKTNQLAQLPSSWYLVAGTGIVLDSSTPNQIVINGTEAESPFPKIFMLAR